MRRIALGSLAAALLAGLLWRQAPEAPAPLAPAALPAAQLGPDVALLGAHNPLTGHDFTPAQVERVRILRSALPDNDLIPTADPAVLARRARTAAEQERRESRIVAGVAPEEEVRAFYGTQRALVADRVELAEFVLQEPGWEPRVYEKYERVRDFAQGQLARIDERENVSVGAAPPRTPHGRGAPQAAAPSPPGADAP